MRAAIFRAVQAFFELLLDLGAVAWLCIYPLLCSIVAFVFFALVAEGRELLWLLIEHRGDGLRGLFSLVLFYGFAAALALATWYCARVLLTRRFPADRAHARTTSDSKTMSTLRIWLPRVLALPPLVPAILFSALTGEPWIYSAAGIVVALPVIGFVISRRRLFPRYFAAPGGPTNAGKEQPWRVAGRTMLDKLPRDTRIAIAAWSVVAGALFVACTLSPVTVPRWLGTGAIVMVALLLWTVFGSFVLVLLPKIYGLPSLAVLAPLALAVASSWTNDNHWPREAEQTVSLADRERELKRTVDEYFDRWIASRHLSGGTYPVFIVTAEGGGLRAAYWTASVLGRLQDRWSGPDRFSDHVFAISGVSGGSLGAAVFAGLVAEAEKGLDVRTPPETCGAGYAEIGRCILRDDFLTPLAAAFLFSDLCQQFFPWPVHWADRARALELSWEASWTRFTGTGTFGKQFEELWRAPGTQTFTANYRIPSLLINATVVEDGRRIIFSNLRIDDSFIDAYDGTYPAADLIIKGQDPLRSTAAIPPLPLSTAVHMGARFTFLSPAARLERNDPPCRPHGCVWGRVVDGGYHENSGAETAEDVLLVILRKIQEEHAGAPVAIVPYLILITNDPDEPPVTRPPETSSDDDLSSRPKHAAWATLPELLSPLHALLAVREARSPYARAAIARVIEQAAAEESVPGTAAPRVFEFYLERKTSNPALGWILSARSDEAMDLALLAPRHQQQIAEIVSLARHTAPREP